MEEAALANHNDSVRLLAEFKAAQGDSVMFPPISPQEAREKKRTDNLRRDHSKKQMMSTPVSYMRSLHQSPSQVMKETGLSRSPPGTNRKKNDPNSLVLNINKKFDKFTAFTTDGNKLGFYVHRKDKEKKKIRLRTERDNKTTSVNASPQ